MHEKLAAIPLPLQLNRCWAVQLDFNSHHEGAHQLAWVPQKPMGLVQRLKGLAGLLTGVLVRVHAHGQAPVGFGHVCGCAGGLGAP